VDTWTGSAPERELKKIREERRLGSTSGPRAGWFQQGSDSEGIMK
jgi:hypothetical protein